ncbi:MAG TPA: 6-carboxytetrahydropterin synthase QueD [Woeseiaceae bacterium]|nr:6-carboxytetrahydropterin synthase QueD [Woeseiaceae bacterium]
MEIYREFRFEAAHSLPHLPEGHKCRQVHGHSYRLIVYVGGEIDPRTGWIMDYADIKRAVDPIIERLDHQNLNAIDDIGYTTVENLARWIWKQLYAALPGLSRIEVKETDTTGCIYAGE